MVGRDVVSLVQRGGLQGNACHLFNASDVCDDFGVLVMSCVRYTVSYSGFSIHYIKLMIKHGQT